MDFDGDQKADIAVLRYAQSGMPRLLNFYNLRSSDGLLQAVQFGDALTDFAAPGDYDGDGKADIAVYRESAVAGGQSFFYIIQSSDSSFRSFPFGTRGDTVVNRDYDGDGKTDYAVFRPLANPNDSPQWWFWHSATNSGLVINYGLSGARNAKGERIWGDVPVPGDYDGDGKFDLAVYRFDYENTRTDRNAFYIIRSSDNEFVAKQFGDFRTDYLLPGDYDGDGKTDYGTARIGKTLTTPLTWQISQSSNNTVRTEIFGFSSDLPSQNDYDGDGKTDIAVWRSGGSAASLANFYILQSTTNSLRGVQWGLGGDFPTAFYDAR